MKAELKTELESEIVHKQEKREGRANSASARGSLKVDSNYNSVSSRREDSEAKKNFEFLNHKIDSVISYTQDFEKRFQHLLNK